LLLFLFSGHLLVLLLLLLLLLQSLWLPQVRRQRALALQVVLQRYAVAIDTSMSASISSSVLALVVQITRGQLDMKEEAHCGGQGEERVGIECPACA
jgi:hypothetical protein